MKHALLSIFTSLSNFLRHVYIHARRIKFKLDITISHLKGGKDDDERNESN